MVAFANCTCVSELIPAFRQYCVVCRTIPSTTASDGTIGANVNVMFMCPDVPLRSILTYAPDVHPGVPVPGTDRQLVDLMVATVPTLTVGMLETLIKSQNRPTIATIINSIGSLSLHPNTRGAQMAFGCAFMKPAGTSYKPPASASYVS
jgi:hypothetical protein